MKNLINKFLPKCIITLTFSVISTLSFAQEEFRCELLPLGSALKFTGASPNGEVFTPKGNLKVLTIFAGFNDDASGGSFIEDQPLESWGTSLTSITDPILAIPTPLMINPDKWMYDDINEFGNGEYNLSEYYYEMSGGLFKMYGDILKDPVTSQYVRIDIDPTGATDWTMCNLKVITKMQQLYPLFDWSFYDNRTNWPNFLSDNSVSLPDSKPDYVIIIYRYSAGWGSQPLSGMNNWVPSTGAYSALTGLGSVNYNGYTFDGAGFTMPAGAGVPEKRLGLFVHELAHELYSSPHQSGNNGTFGEHWNFPSTGWGMMTRSLNFTANGWDRWMLGWINLSVGTTPINTDIQSSLDLTNNGIYTLRDYVTTGDVVRIKIPNTIDQYLWLENHQSISQFDKKPWAGLSPSPNGELIPEMSKGLYMYKEKIHGDRDNVSTGMVDDLDKVNGIELLNANGNFDYEHSEFGILDWNWWWYNPVFNFKRMAENPIEGCSNYQNYPDDYPTTITSGGSNNLITYSGNWNNGSYEAHPILRENDGINDVSTYANTGGLNYEATNLLGRRTDVFVTGDEVSLSGIVPAFNYPIYDMINSMKEPYIINGLSVKVVSENLLNGEVTIQISFDDYDMRNDKRWTGNLSLPAPVGSSLYSLNIKSNVSLTIDKSGTPNRHTLSPDNDFINPTRLTCESGSYFHLEPNAIVNVINGSALRLLSGSKMELEAGAILHLFENSALIIEDGAELNLKPGAQLIIEEGATVTYKNSTANKGLLVGATTNTGNPAIVEVYGDMTFISGSSWEHYRDGFYRFHSTHTLTVQPTVPITFKGLGKTVKFLELESATTLTINGNVVNWSLGLVQYGSGAVVKMNTLTDFHGTSVTFNTQPTSSPTSTGILTDDPKTFITNQCDWFYFDKAIKITNAPSASLLLLASTYKDNTTAIDLDNVGKITIAGSHFSTGLTGINANNSFGIIVSSSEILGITNGVRLNNVKGFYLNNSDINYSATGIYGTDALVFLRTGSKVHNCDNGVELFGSYDYAGANYTSMLTMGDAGCGSVYGNVIGIAGRDFILNIDAEQHAIDRGIPSQVIPNRFDNNSTYTFDICYTKVIPSVAPLQINAQGNYWGNGNILPGNYRIKESNTCITKPNQGTNISLISSNYSTCVPVNSCMDCNTSPGTTFPGNGGGLSNAAVNVRNAFENANAPFVVEDMVLTRLGFNDLSAVEIIKDTTDSSWTARSVNNEVFALETEGVHRIQVSKAIKAAAVDPNAKMSYLPNDIFAGVTAEEKTVDDFTLYPNPANEIVNIFTNNDELFNYVLVNVLGEEITKGTFNKTIAIKTKNLSGVYFIEVTNESGRKKIKKLVVNH